MTTLRCLGAVALAASATAFTECTTFEKIYGNGKDMCEKMWGNAFVYTPETSANPAYTMWWFQDTNPNDQTTKDILALPRTAETRELYGADSTTGQGDLCWDNAHSKTTPTAEPGMTECKPWKDRSCCKASTVKDDAAIKSLYGAKYHWDRCGQLSAQCHAFFVYEACFYECEPAAELFRKFPKHPSSVDDPRHYHNASADSTRDWELYKMPIQASFCDRWYDACRTDMFCATDSGDFFSCANRYVEPSSDDDLATGTVVLIVVLSVVAAAALVFGIFLVVKEKRGEPVYYKPVATGPSEPTSEGPKTFE